MAHDLGLVFNEIIGYNATKNQCFEAEKIGDEHLPMPSLPSSINDGVQIIEKAAGEVDDTRRWELEQKILDMLLDDYDDTMLFYEEEIVEPKCAPYSEAMTQLKRFNDEFPSKKAVKGAYGRNEEQSRLYSECKTAFENEICDASNYICIPEFAGDCEGISGQEYVCLILLGAYNSYDSLYSYGSYQY